MLMSRFYRFYHYLAQVLIWIFVRRFVVRGLHHVPRCGPAILMGNHMSYSDPVLIIGTLPRQVFFMTKSEMFDGGFMDWVITQAEAFPIRRGEVDLRALRHAVGVVGRGDLLGIYPEGTRSKDHQLQHGHAGIILLARQTQAPLIPVAVTGTDQLFSRRFPWICRPTVTITYGRPFMLSELLTHPDERPSRDELTQRVMSRLAELLPQEYGGSRALIQSY
jgi:1-acyl-sn-glycerol-3-phosphate acyltransferase